MILNGNKKQRLIALQKNPRSTEMEMAEKKIQTQKKKTQIHEGKSKKLILTFSIFCKKCIYIQNGKKYNAIKSKMNKE